MSLTIPLLVLLCVAPVSAASVKSTFEVPPGYQRDSLPGAAFGAYLRDLDVLPDSTPVTYFDGQVSREWPPGTWVVDLPFLFPVDLEQCADMAMRLYAEYCWRRGTTTQLVFPLQNGQVLDWNEWKQGQCRRFDFGTDRHVVRQSDPDSSRASFEKYLHYLFLWSGSVALKAKLLAIAAEDLQAGDLIVQNTTGALGHVSIILDVVRNKKGKRLFLIANGWTPAQSLFIRKPEFGNGDGYWFSLEGYERQLRSYNFGPFHYRRF